MKIWFINKCLLLIILIFCIVYTTACSMKSRSQNRVAAAQPVMVVDEDCERPEAQSVKYFLMSADGTEKQDTIRVKSMGYGAPPKKYYPQYQRDLMAMRASKVDAYRSLAETINGLHIWGGTTLGDMAVQDDHYRVFLDSYVRGAMVESTKQRDDGNYETVVSTVVDRNFLNYVLSDHLTRNAECGSMVSAYGANNGLAPAVYSEGIAPSSFYYSE